MKCNALKHKDYYIKHYALTPQRHVKEWLIILLCFVKLSKDETYVKINSRKRKFYDYAGCSTIDEPYMVKNQEEYDYRYSINVWQRYASPVWFDIRQTNTLNTKQAKEDKDNKHICPLQLDVIERCIALWTNPNELVFSPFTGIGSEGYQAIKQGRKFVGSELKEAYFNVAVNNLKDAVAEKKSLFDDKSFNPYSNTKSANRYKLIISMV